MEILTGIGSVAINYIVPFLFVLTIVVFFHELGHFLVARWCGVGVKVFSVGFGPELFGRYDRHGTRWRLSAVPLGGYVRFDGDDSAASTPDQEALENMSAEEMNRAFHGKSVWRRAAIVAAGPIANFILAIVIFAMTFAIVGRPMTSPIVDQVVAGSAAETAGFQSGDVVREIDGVKIESFSDIQRIVSVNADVALKVTVDRGGQMVNLVATPKLSEQKDRFGNVFRVGLLGISRRTTAESIVVERMSPPQALWAGTAETWFVLKRTLVYVGNVITGREAADQLGGPIRVAQVSGQLATLGFGALLNLAAILSVSIGLLNLFPVPLLDGGHLVFYAIEGIRGRPLSDRAQDIGFKIGFALVVMLMVFVTWNDIVRLTQL